MDSDALKLCLVVGSIALALMYRRSAKGRTRITPYREALVPEKFHLVCTDESSRRTIVWICLAVDQHVSEIAESMERQLGWRFVCIVPDGPVPTPKTLQFYQRQEIEAAVKSAYCIFSGPGVIETAAATARNSALPLVLVTSAPLGDWIQQAMKFTEEVFIVNSTRSAERANSQFGRPTILLPPLIFPKQFRTHTTRKFVTLVGPGWQMDQVMESLPHVKFLGIGNCTLAPNCTLVSPNQLQEAYSQTDILCILGNSEDYCRIALEAAASGIPIVGTPANGLTEAMNDAAIQVPLAEIPAALATLKNDPIAYKTQREASLERAAALDPVRTLEAFSQWLLSVVGQV
jgi:hypothetical protein